MRTNRRTFLQAGLGVAAQAALPANISASSNSGKLRPRLGIVVSAGKDESPDEALARVKRLGFTTCQMSVGRAPADLAMPIKDAAAKYQIEITALITLGEGRMVWTLRDGPKTIGIIPRDTRAERVDALKRASDLARSCGVKAVHTHCGFIPENPNNALYGEAVKVIRDIATYLRNNGQTFLMETGQETPITLLRTIQDVGLDNLAVNLDVANLILYGRGEPVGALDVLGQHVRGMHAKDGLYPKDPYGLGEETAIGKGRVRFPEVIAGLYRLSYTGPITIEREISGPEQEHDIADSKRYLDGLIDKEWGVGSAAA